MQLSFASYVSYLIVILKAFLISGNSESQDAHRANFVRLVHAHFVERCPIAQPVVEPVPESALNKRRGAKLSIKQYLPYAFKVCVGFCRVIVPWHPLTL